MKTSFFILVLALGLAAGCRGQRSKEAPIVPIRNMYHQPRYNPQAESPFFQDRRTMRPAVEGTVAREMEIEPEVSLGRFSDDSGYVLEIPDSVSAGFAGWSNMMDRGQKRYAIYCAPCHGASGNGEGIVVKRGMLPPPSFHDPRLRHIPDGQLYATIRNGLGNMPSYRHMIPVQDRWAIVAYVRALQLSQAPSSELAVVEQPSDSDSEEVKKESSP
ncbi:MAG: cytochrome c [Myxococcales bacterium]|nr:MAG: cytochrome c [Myxococcales bacterium]